MSRVIKVDSDDLVACKAEIEAYIKSLNQALSSYENGISSMHADWQDDDYAQLRSTIVSLNDDLQNMTALATSINAELTRRIALIDESAKIEI